MNTSERLTELRDTLVNRQVVDVKFYFERGSLSSLPKSVVAGKVADFLECYVAGRGKSVRKVGDEV